MRVAGTVRTFVAMIALAVLAACAADDRSPTVTTTTVAALVQARPEIASMVARAREAPARETDAGFVFVRPAARRRWSEPGVVQAIVGRYASDVLTLRASGVEMRVRLRDARAAPGVVEDGAVVHADAAPGVDLVTFDRRDGVESLVVLRARASIAWELDARDGTARSLADDLVELVDVAGRPRVRLRADVGWGADGRAFHPRLRVDGRAISLEIPSGVALPAIVDPTWVATARPLRPRTQHTATLLPDGTVYLHGGCESSAGDTKIDPTDVCGLPTTSEIFDPVAGTFSLLPSTVPPIPVEARRFAHTATTLADGRVLVVGGYDRSGKALDDVQIYDPATSVLTTSAAKLATPRGGHSATLLRSGHVLLVGGTTGFGATGAGIDTVEEIDAQTAKNVGVVRMSMARKTPRAVRLPSGDVLVASDGSYEIYSAGTGTFASPVTVSGIDEIHTATLLADGRVAVTGHVFGSDVVHAARIDPASGVVASMTAPTQRGTDWSAALLPDGDLILVGGETSGTTLTDVLGPGAASFTSLAGSDLAHRVFATLTVLADGRVLYVGGGNDGITGDDEARILDPLLAPDAGSATVTAVRTLAERSTVTLLPSGKLLVAGGILSDGKIVADTSLYDPVADTLAPAAKMTTPRAGHSAVLLPSGKVLIVGGESAPFVATNTTELYDPATDTFTAAGPLARPRYDAAIVLASWGKVLVFGGCGASCFKSDVISTVEQLDAVTAKSVGEWKATQRHFGVATTLVDGRVLVTGGQDAEGFAVADSEIFDDRGNVTHVPLHQARFDHTATVLPDGRVLIAGGTTDVSPVNPTASIEILDPVAKLSSTIGSLIVPRFGHSAKLLTGGQVVFLGGGTSPPGGAEVEVFDPRTGALSLIAPLPAPTDRAGAFVLGDDSVLMLGGGLPPTPGVRWSAGRVLAPLSPSVTDVVSDTGAPLTIGSDVVVHGDHLDGWSESVSGDGRASGTNVPVAIWQPFGDQPPQLGGMHDWTSTQSRWHIENEWPHGWGWLHVSTSGAASPAVSIRIAGVAQGQKCQGDTDCASGACEDDLCCDRHCDPCEACVGELKNDPVDGTCGPVRAGGLHVKKVGTQDVPDCVQSPAPTCGNDGTCDGAGHCANWADGTRCGVGAVCQGGACTALSHALCDGDHTLTNGDGTTTSCAPFACTAQGTCAARCASASDCAGGYRCDADGACVQPTPTSIEDRGCGCVVAGEDARAPWLRWTAGAWIAIVLLRRRARRMLT